MVMVSGVCYNREEGFSLNTQFKRHMMFQHFCEIYPSDVALLKLRRPNGLVSLDIPLNEFETNKIIVQNSYMLFDIGDCSLLLFRSREIFLKRNRRKQTFPFQVRKKLTRCHL